MVHANLGAAVTQVKYWRVLDYCSKNWGARRKNFYMSECSYT